MMKCPIGRQEFLASAAPVKVEINGMPFQAMVKEFSTGSFGWNLNGKVSIEVDGKPLNCQIGMNLTVVGSKEMPK